MATTATTTIYQYPYPLGGDSLSNVATRIKELADRIETIGTTYSLGTTPSTSDSSTKIASTAYVNALIASVNGGTPMVNVITNAMINTSANISSSKLDLANVITNTMINTSANIASSKLDLSTYAGHTIAASAATRPVSPFAGQMIYQTDTDEFLKWVVDLDGTSRWMIADHDYNRNLIINGAFDVWQRGTTFNPISIAATAYGADRWQMLQATTNTSNAFVRTATTTAAPDPSGFTYYTRVQRTSALTFITPFTLQTSVETTTARRIAGKFVTLSFWARAGANYSAASNYLVSDIITGTGTDSNIVTGFTGQTTSATANNVLTTSWKRFTVTTSAAIAANITQLGVRFVFTPNGTAGANDYFDITGVQVEPYSAPSDFEFRPFDEELRRCQRYYYRITADATNTQKHMGMGFANSTTVAEVMVPFPVSMRIVPALDTTITVTNLRLSDNTTNTVLTALAVVSLGQSEYQGVVNATVASGLTAFRPMMLQSAAAATGFIGFNSEL